MSSSLSPSLSTPYSTSRSSFCSSSSHSSPTPTSQGRSSSSSSTFSSLNLSSSSSSSSLSSSFFPNNNPHHLYHSHPYPHPSPPPSTLSRSRATSADKATHSTLVPPEHPRQSFARYTLNPASPLHPSNQHFHPYHHQPYHQNHLRPYSYPYHRHPQDSHPYPHQNQHPRQVQHQALKRHEHRPFLSQMSLQSEVFVPRQGEDFEVQPCSANDFFHGRRSTRSSSYAHHARQQQQQQQPQPYHGKLQDQHQLDQLDLELEDDQHILRPAKYTPHPYHPHHHHRAQQPPAQPFAPSRTYDDSRSPSLSPTRSSDSREGSPCWVDEGFGSMSEGSLTRNSSLDYGLGHHPGLDQAQVQGRTLRLSSSMMSLASACSASSILSMSSASSTVPPSARRSGRQCSRDEDDDEDDGEDEEDDEEEDEDYDEDEDQGMDFRTGDASSSFSSSMASLPVPRQGGFRQFKNMKQQQSGNNQDPSLMLLLCPVCHRAFKPSKNQNCNLRRHLKNVHNMSPTLHPRKCKWDSLPDGRVKDDKDRKERTRKSKRLWARKFRLRRKVEEAAEVLSMLSQAM